jgi:hypothetical protein
LFQDVLDPGFRRGDDPIVFYEIINFDGFAKSLKIVFSAIPVETGIQSFL